LIESRREIPALAVLTFHRRRPRPASGEPTDAELLSLFGREPESAWDVFIDRYADLILLCLHDLGFDHDQAMDRFIYVCEKLCEQRFRRLRTIRFAGRRGELAPWLRTVVRHLAINWAWSVDGRRRLFKSIGELPRREQRVFELYFWHGLTPSRVHEQLRVEQQAEVSYTEVYDALEAVFARLSRDQTWRLMSRLAGNRAALAIAAEDPETGLAFEPAAGGDDPEQTLMAKQRRETLEQALAKLSPRERLILRLRYDNALSLVEVAEIVNLGLSTVKSSIRASLDELREALRETAATAGGRAC
jgi:RNA polymerase sigma factor (sigma-70 family)